MLKWSEAHSRSEHNMVIYGAYDIMRSLDHGAPKGKDSELSYKDKAEGSWEWLQFFRVMAKYKELEHGSDLGNAFWRFKEVIGRPSQQEWGKLS